MIAAARLRRLATVPAAIRHPREGGGPSPELRTTKPRRRSPRAGPGARSLQAPLAAAVLLLAGCTASTTGGVRGQTAFAATARLEVHASPHPAAAIAACFRANGRFLPKSRFTVDPDGSARYTLAGFGLWFEDFHFIATPEGSRTEVQTSAAYDARWITLLARDRLEPLGACLADPRHRS